MNAYKFVKGAREIKPATLITALLERAQDKERLSQLSLIREEKDKIADVLYGTFSSNSSTYKLLGWAWPMAPYLKRILVSFTYEPGKFSTYYAPDKTSLRKVLGSVHEMIVA
jgi:hypothetical protein